ncbi:MAG: hypothetical protein AB7S38_16440 [Vulcanimicrobiota bacterium]
MLVTSPPVRPSSYENTDARPSWSPDGQKITAEVGRDAVVVSRDNELLARLGPDDRWVGTPQFSPDGSQIAYGCYTTPEDKPLPSWGVYVCDADGSDPVALTHNGRKPQFSPDGSKIAFQGYHDLRKDRVAIMDANGFNEHTVSKKGAYQKHFCWSPDSQQLAYESLTEDGQQIRLTDVSGDNDHWLTEGQFGQYWDRHPEFAPDGRSVLYERHHKKLPLDELWLVDPVSKQEKLLYNPMGLALDAVWSPDGQKIAFIANENGGLDYDLYVMDKNGHGVKRLTTTPATIEHAPSFSPDGKSLAYLTISPGKEGDERFGLRIVDL